MNQSVPIITTYNTVANVPYTLELSLNYPYFRANLKNTGLVAQTFLNYEVMYREAVIETSLEMKNITVNQGTNPWITTGSIVAGGNTATVTNSGMLNVIASQNGTTPYLATISNGGNNANVSVSGNLNVVDSIGNTSLSSIVTNTSNTNNSVQTLINQGLGNGGYMWGLVTGPTTGLVNGAISSVINLTQKSSPTVTYMGSNSEVVTITIQYSPDNTNWFDSPQVFTQGSAGTFSLDTVSGAGYFRAILSNVVTTVDIFLAINHI